MAAPGQNQPIIYNESDGQADPRSAANQGGDAAGIKRWSEDNNKHVATGIKEGNIKDVTNKMSKLPGFAISPDKIEQAINPQYRKQQKDTDNPNAQKENLNTMDAHGNVVSETGNESVIKDKNNGENEHPRTPPSEEAYIAAPAQEPNSQTKPSTNEPKTEGDEDKFKRALDGVAEENTSLLPAYQDLPTTGEFMSTISSKLPVMTRHQQLEEYEKDNLQVNNEMEHLNYESAPDASTRSIAPSSKQFDNTGASASVKPKETDEKLDKSHSAAAQAQQSAKGTVDVDENEEVTSWKSPNLKYRQPLKPASPDSVVFHLQRKALKYIVMSCAVCYLFGKLNLGWIAGLLSILGGAFAWWRLGTETKEGIEWQIEKDEAMKTLYTSEGETVEWLNYCVEKVWRSIDPQIFVQVEDILEDTLQSLAPKVILSRSLTSTLVSKLPVFKCKIRIFPPLPGQPDESIFGEASFSFHAHPVASLSTARKSLSAPPGIGIRFKTGINASLDIKAELTTVSGKIRFKMLTSPEIPFVSKVTIAFTSVPKIETGVMPVSKHMNIMHLPLIKTLVNEGVKLGFAGLVDPKSMTIDVQALMGAAAHDTAAIGVVKVDFIEAIRTAKSVQDMEDSYASLSLSNSPGRSMSTTRILTNDKDPRWNESLYLLVHEDDITSDNRVELKVWDADKIKFDDVWGQIGIAVKDIVLSKTDKLGNVTDWCNDERQVFDGWAPIDGAKDLESSKIKLHYRMSWHPKYVAPKPQVLERNKGEDQSQPQNQTVQAEKKDDAVKVDPAHNSGILSITLHQAMELEVADQELIDDKGKHPYSSGTVVSPYALVYINDEKVFRTRSKMRNPSPHWNAVTEHFVRDLDSTFVRISVKHAVELERDPVLGTRVVKLRDAFENQSDDIKETQRWLPLKDGIGFGKILVTMRFKPVKLSLPKQLTGSMVGTLVIDKITFKGFGEPFSSNLKSLKAVLAANVVPAMNKNLKAKDSDQQSLENPSGNEVSWSGKRLYFPIVMRYRTAIYVHLTSGGMNGKRVTGRLWLRNIHDDDAQDITIGMHEGLLHNSKEANRNTDDWDQSGPNGTCTLHTLFIPGYSSVHTNLQSFRKDMVGADPFKELQNDRDSQDWAKAHAEASGDKGKRKRSSSISTEASSEYGSESDDATDDDDEDGVLMRELLNSGRSEKIRKYRVLRKLAWSRDIVKDKVESIRGGFNSEQRMNRSVAKEA
ncbi:hypothetical protein NQZ79_g5470 [Umbelopsis isabellina]|nr:hypothetical protein NQZ79_g5470 [Umbelopsis isabellina]